jgi:hypothetical protein
MKIAITGHTIGLGKAFSNILKERGHEIVGISKSRGNDINNTAQVCNIIDTCDLFINNAQSNYAQNNLLYEMWKRWKGLKKYIWNIGTYNPFQLQNHNNEDSLEYVIQKLSLKKMIEILNSKSIWPMISLLNPCKVSIKNENIIKNMKEYYSDKELKNLIDIKTNNEFYNTYTPEEWVKCVIDIFNINNNIHISEISISYNESSNKIKI